MTAQEQPVQQDARVDDLLAFLSMRKATVSLPVPDASSAAARNILVAPPAPHFYLEPHLSLIAHHSSGHPFCCLIDAPAGVGKTALAHNIMRRLCGPDRLVIYIPLKGAIIGHGFFSGLLSDLFPHTPKALLLDAVFSGHVVLLFDGYDEISMTSAQLELNHLFIKEVLAAAEQISIPVQPSIVFLFRSVFFEFGIFDDAVPLSRHYRVKYFDRSQRRRYLTGRLQAVPPGRIKGLAAGNIPSVVDNFLRGFETRLTVASTEQEDAFFGHALVLSALVDYVTETLDEATSENAHKISQDFSFERLDTLQSVALLKGVEEKILEREQGKFADEAFRSAVPGFVGYPPGLQRDLLTTLARHVVTNGLQASNLVSSLRNLGGQRLESYTAYHGLPAEQQQSLMDNYLEELRNRLDNHPFVDFTVTNQYRFRNPVYEEFYLARCVAASPADSQMLMAGARTPSYFLALFLLDGLSGDLSSHSGLLFQIISLLSTSCNGWEYRVVLERGNGGSRWVGSVTSSNIVIPPFFLSEEILLMEVPPGAVLQHLDIIGANHIVGILTAGHDHSAHMTLSDAEITADHLELDANRVVFESVIVRANSLQFGERVQGVEGIDTLTLWAGHGLNLTAPERVRTRLQALADEGQQAAADNLSTFQSKLKKILSWFRRHGRDTYGVYEPRFWTVATNKRADHAAVRIVGCLVGQGILSFRDGFVFLEQANLEKYGVHYVKQNEIAFKETVRDLFAVYSRG